MWRVLLPLGRQRKADLETLKTFLETSDYRKVKWLMRNRKIGVAYTSLKIKIADDISYPQLNPAIHNKDLVRLCETWNSIIEQKAREQKYEEFSEVADKTITKFLAEHIVGMDEVKEAASLQLFATDKTHILLLGDPGTGKTDILKAVDDLAPISSYGLGSGTSSAGLTVTFKGNEMIKGLLPMADDGICCVDELNLMKTRERGSLLNAMEKGFITYDKGSKHIKLDAHISLLATANPKGDKFVGRTPGTWLKQIPFDSALLSRFHLVFFIRKPTNKQFVDITKKIVSDSNKTIDMNDALFIRDYIEFSHMIKVRFDTKLKNSIIEFAEKLKTDEKDFLVEVSPRLIIGIMRLAKASARMELRRVVEQKDLDRVFEIYKKSLYVK